MGKKEETIRNISGNILKTLFRHQKSSRTRISKSLKITPATITNMISYLVAEKKVIETGDEVRDYIGSGRSRRLITVNSQYRHYIGIEINANGIYLAVTDTIGNLITNSNIKITEYDSKQINEIIIQLVTETLDKFSYLEFGALGIAVPGHFDSKSGHIISNNVKWIYFDLAVIKQSISIPIFLENNINCMAIGSYLFHPESSPEQFLFIHIGPGLVCSFFDSEHILQNKNFYIGEIGHTVVDLNGPSCECGKRGCLQTYISDTWLINNARFLFENVQGSIIKTLVEKPEDITLDVVYNAYRLGDGFIIKKIESGIDFLTTSIANTLIIYDSKKIFINSQLLNYPGFSEKVNNLVDNQLQFIPSKNNLDIEFLSFNIFRGAIGAASLAVYNHFILENNSN
ncbi:ROK family protein [Streptococcus suis]|uniref:ROK family protein n=1 Tax=Streptococcus suis TaxID=1307 RepID=UPI002FCBF3A3